MICEKCGKEHDGSFGSGRFCSRACANSRIRTEELKRRLSKLFSKTEKRFCKDCGKPLDSRNSTGFCKDCCRKHRMTDELKEKLRKTSKAARCGGYREKSGTIYSGWYKGFYCNSRWELAFVIYNLDHEIEFERNKIGFEYVSNGEIHKYYPDFKIGDTYYEIKGRRNNRWDEKLRTFKYPLIVLYRKEMQKYLKYVYQKYGTKRIEMLYEKTELGAVGSNPIGPAMN